MAETRYQEIKRYVRFGERDAELLVAFGERAAPELPRVVQNFYDRIREHDEAHAVLQGEEQIQRLQRSLVAWLERVFGGRYDEAFHEQTATIGRVHVRVGLPQRYMLTAMSLIRLELLQLADRFLGRDAAATQSAITRILDLELAIMLEAYKDSYVERLEQAAKQERVQLGTALAQAERRYVNAVELAGVIIVGLDASGRIRLFNREAERVTGFARDEVQGRSFVDVLGLAEDSSNLPELMAQVLSRGSSAPVPGGTLRTRAGKLRDVVWQLSPSDETGADVALLATGRDVTDELASEERARQNERLAAIGTLAAGLAHEIRNPLNGAQLHVSFLERAIKRGANEQDMLEATRVVGEEIKRLANLVTEFLDFARPKPPDLKPTSVLKMLEHACSLVDAGARSAGVKVETDLPSNDVELMADGAKLTQVLLNLLNNAVEACTGMENGAVWLRARRGPRHIFIEVEDNGPGLPSPEAPIFDAFYSTKEGGTGLGLAITHRIVTDHLGSIDVHSQPGKTKFRVTLPLEQATGVTV